MSAALQSPLGRIRLGSTPLTIGTTPDNRLVLNNSQASSPLAVVNPSGPGHTIAAVGDVHSVSVNGQSLEPERLHWLRPGDTIRIGEMTFTYEEDQPAQYTPEQPVAAEENPYGDKENPYGDNPYYDDEKTIKAPPRPVVSEQASSIKEDEAAKEDAGTREEPPTVRESSVPLPPVPPPAREPSAPRASAPLPPVPTAYNSGSQWPQYQAVDIRQTPQPFAPQPFAPVQGPPSGASWQQASGPFAPVQGPPSGVSWQAGQQANAPFAPVQGPPSGVSWQTGQQASAPGAPLQPSPVKPKMTMSPLQLLLIALAALLVLVLVGSGIAIYQLTRPQPIIAVTSQYMMGTTPAGSAGTRLHVLGYKFSSNSTISFLLDGNLAPGQPVVQSDADGNFSADLAVTSDWSVGTHKLTARDSGNYLTKNVGSITVVHQGEAHTPGPNGAPPDDASFSVKVTISASGGSFARLLTVTAQPGRDSGTVCDVALDTNQPTNSTGTAQDGTAYKASATYSCNGTYKGGKINYSETISNEKTDFANGVSCQITSGTALQVNGTFTSATSISGTFTRPGASVSCSQGGQSNTNNVAGDSGSWTGSLV